MSPSLPTRRLARLAFSTGMVILLASLIGWAVSMWGVGYRTFWDAGRKNLTVSLDRGELWATTEGTYWGPGWGVLRPLGNPFPPSRMTWWPYDGSFWGTSQYGWDLNVPLWMPALAGMAMAAGGSGGWWRYRIANRRRRRGLCEGCGYDMSGSGGVCPECGAAHAPANAHRERVAAAESRQEG